MIKFEVKILWLRSTGPSSMIQSLQSSAFAPQRLRHLDLSLKNPSKQMARNTFNDDVTI